MWVDSSAIGGLNDNDPISSWNDLSGNANHATQSVANSKPTYKVNAQNGKAGVLFDSLAGTAGQRQSLSTTNLSGLSSYTCICVTLPNFSSGNFKTIIQKGTSASNNNSWGILFRASNVLQVSDSSNGTSSTANFWNIPSITNIPSIVSTYDDGTFIFQRYLAASLSVNRFIASGTPFLSSSPISIGSSTVGASPNTFDGYLLELIVYNRVLTDSERAGIEFHLKNKWGI